MKRARFLAFFISVTMALTLAAPALAAETRASDQINYYSMDAEAGKGSLNVTFDVCGFGSMDKIGCQSIYIYGTSGGAPVDSRFEDDANMSKTNTIRYKNTITFSGEAGVRYRIVVTIFAEDSDGRDTRQETFYVTGK